MNSFWIMRTNAGNRGSYAALYTTAWSIAQILAPIIGALAISFVSFALLWWITAAICLFAAGGFVLLLRANFSEKQVALEEKIF